jgi:hypothetical protein
MLSARRSTIASGEAAPAREGARNMIAPGGREPRLGATWCLAALLVFLTACTGSTRSPSHDVLRPSPSPPRTHLIYRQAKMDRIAHFLSKYWDGGRGDPLDVYNLQVTHSTATGCRFGGFHAFHERGDLAFHETRHDARVELHSNGAEVVGFGQYRGDWWAVAEDCS